MPTHFLQTRPLFTDIHPREIFVNVTNSSHSGGYPTLAAETLIPTPNETDSPYDNWMITTRVGENGQLDYVQ